MLRLDGDLGGPFDLILGLPVHSLVVHAAVVFIPLAALLSLIAAYKKSFSRRFGPLILASAVLGQVFSFLAKSSGEPFEERLGIEVERHSEFGETAPLASLPMLFLLALLLYVDKSKHANKPVRTVLAVMLVFSALGAAGYMYLTGHSGTEAVWSWVNDI